MNRIIRRSLFILAMLAMQLLTPLARAESSGISILTDRDVSPLDLRVPKPLSRDEETALTPKDRFRECKQCPEMVVIPGGAFIMGASVNETGSTPDERPQHEVSIQRFSVGELPVTVDEWMACVLAQGCSYRPQGITAGDGRQAVGNIMWDDAREYVQWLSRVTGRTYRLPSEAEREYATRAGTTTAFWWGDAPDPNETDGSTLRRADTASAQAAALASTTPGANPFGLYEVHGNSYDWVEDCWHETYQSAPADGSAWIEDDCGGHVLRGGAASRSPQTRRSAARMWSGSQNRLVYMSVRVARSRAQ
jgi:formylglycine-generating enzyme required for sulfatase activity